MELGQAIVVDDLRSVELSPSQPAVYDRPIGLRLLYEDSVSGAEHYLGRYPAELGAQPHRHTARRGLSACSSSSSTAPSTWSR